MRSLPLPAEQGTPEMLYQLYRLVIASDNFFTGKTSIGNRGFDVQVQSISPPEPRSSPSSWFMNWTLPGGEKWLSCAKTDIGYLLRFNELADFTVDRIGTEIVCIPKPRIPENTIQHLFLDQVIPLVINLKGREALHASSVRMPQGIIAFVGQAGSGKSTLAASFFASGCPLVSDDCLALIEKNRKIFGIPAYPGLRLWKDSYKGLFGNNGKSRPVAHYTTKQQVDIEASGGMFCKLPKPLIRIYDVVMNGRSRIKIKPLSPREGFMCLVKAVFRLDITDTKMLKRQFKFLEKVVSSVPVRRLIYPRNFKILPDVREAILNDLKT